MPQQQSGPLLIQPLTLVQLSHEALAETLHLAGALALGLKIRPTLRQVAGMWGNVRHRSPCRCITKAVLDAGPHQQLLALAEPIGSEVMAFLKVCSNLQQQARGERMSVEQ
jgi:ABC-type cobalamin transport system ATPase subunit